MWRAILEDLAAIHTDAARYAEAYRCGSRAGSLIKQLWGADHPYLAMNLDALAKVEIGQGAAALARGKTDAAEEHFSKAEAFCQEARRIVQQALGPESCWLAEVQYTRGRLEVARHSPAAARAPFEQAEASGRPSSTTSFCRRSASRPRRSASWETWPRWTTTRP